MENWVNGTQRWHISIPVNPSAPLDPTMYHSSLFLTLCLFVVAGCTEPVELKDLRESDGLMYEHRLYSGSAIGHYDNGKQQSKGTYSDGAKNGTWTTWYDDGQKKSEGTFNKGLKDGVWVNWHQNAVKWSEGAYSSEQQVEKPAPWTPRWERAGWTAGSQKVGAWTYWNEEGEEIWQGVSQNNQLIAVFESCLQGDSHWWVEFRDLDGTKISLDHPSALEDFCDVGFNMPNPSRVNKWYRMSFKETVKTVCDKFDPQRAMCVASHKETGHEVAAVHDLQTDNAVDAGSCIH